jgi:SAM-dependent methyltransferase
LLTLTSRLGFNADMLNGHKCPFCGGRILRPVDARPYEGSHPDYAVIECRACEVAWQWPAIRDSETSRAYFDDLYESGTGYSDPDAVLGRVEIEVEILNSLREPGTLLDIGAGNGAFVKAARAAEWDAVGVDPAAPDCPHMIRGTLDEVTGSFDAITLFDVVEHVEDYPSLLRAVFNRLSPKGLVVIETGNYQSLNRLRGGPAWWDYQLDHRWYLAPSVLADQLAAIGYRNPRVIPRVARPHWKRESSEPVSPSSTVKRIVKRPHKAAKLLADYKTERRAAAKWPGWYFLPIFLMVATKS